MAIATRPRRSFRWTPPRVITVAMTTLVIGVTAGMVLWSGSFGGGQQGTPAVVSPSGVPSSSATPPSPTPTPASPSATPTPTSVLAQLHGKIAVARDSGGGGWITLPGGGYTPDPTSNVTLGSGWPSGLTHVLALNRWVPVPRRSVSSDGMKYAYVEGPVIHVVRAGRTELELPSPYAEGAVSASILSTENNGVYVYSIAPGAGVWWVPFSGSPQQIARTGYWSEADGRYAYGALTSLAQPNDRTILRLDLSDGSMTSVFSQPGVTAWEVGVAAGGDVVVTAALHGSGIWLARPGVVRWISDGTAVSVVADRMGTWIMTDHGLYLYTETAGFEYASPVTGELSSAFRS